MAPKRFARGRRHDSPHGEHVIGPERRLAASTIRPVGRKRAGLQDGCSQCPRTLYGWEGDHVQLRFRQTELSSLGVRHPEEVARVRRCEPLRRTPMDVYGRLWMAPRAGFEMVGKSLSQDVMREPN